VPSVEPLVSRGFAHFRRHEEPQLVRDLVLRVQEVRSGASVTAQLTVTNRFEEDLQAMFDEVEQLLTLDLIPG
jgi:hypothetical protein